MTSIEKTVYVIGAGASSEANMPLGPGFQKKITELLNIRYHRIDRNMLDTGDTVIAKALKILSEGDLSSLDKYREAALQISNGLSITTSIDNYIHNFEDNEKIAICGKLAIARCILEAESGSLLYINSNPSHPDNRMSEQMKDTWYMSFFQSLLYGCNRNNLPDRLKSITLIIFNYDRCVEHFLFNILQEYWEYTPEQSSELVNLINIYHPYGSVGSLPWSKQNIKHMQNEHTSFGSFNEDNVDHVGKLIKLSNGLKTFTEGVNPDSSEIVDIRDQMAKADKIIFLGFAFHELNMRVLAPNHVDHDRKEPKCYATTYRIHEPDIVKDQIYSLVSPAHPGVKMENLRCNKFYERLEKSLAFKLPSS
jgi:hypothetical protein